MSIIECTTPITRTLRRLAQSTPEHREQVRILFYGQSITKQEWWLAVVEGLRARYPHAEIAARNPALGGFGSQKLVETVHRDVCDFHPDLLIFHVFGDHHRYEDIIRCIRAHTTTEVALQTDHFSSRQDPSVADDDWSAFWNGSFLPAIAETYGCALLDVRRGWRQHLLDQHLAATDLLSDGAHMNTAGCALMAQLVLEELFAHAEDGPAAIDAQITTVPLGEQARFVDGKLTLEFTGNRVVAIAGAGEAPGTPVRVLIDGQPPSAYAGAYTFTRANAHVKEDWPWFHCVPYRITWAQPPVAEEWTLTITAGDATALSFTLEGSVTGPDGAGQFTFPEREEGPYDPPFVSNSGRVVIDPRHWWRQTSKQRPNPSRPGYVVQFQSVLQSIDVYQAPASDPACPAEVVLAQGLPNTRHTLELFTDDPAAARLGALRLHCPPLNEALPRISEAARE